MVAINADTLIYPVFIKPGKHLREEIPHMPEIYRFSPDTVLHEVEQLLQMGIRRFLLFGIPAVKDYQGSEAYSGTNAVCEAVRMLRRTLPEALLFTDVCLCAYTTHGHCGIMHKDKTGIDQQKTLLKLIKIALAHAEAGADYVAPSAMVRGQVDAIRTALITHGYESTRIMGYSAKFASQAYGPFRGIADSAPRFGDRRGYQLDYTDREEALRRIEEDSQAGADIVMVKPAMWYLDIVREAKSRTNRPLAVYNVSGEYAAVKAGARDGFWDERPLVLELLHSFKRAGADFIITYHAKEIAQWGL